MYWSNEVCPDRQRTGCAQRRRIDPAGAAALRSNVVHASDESARRFVRHTIVCNTRMQGVDAMATIGFIGAGNIGAQVARLAVANGYDVVMSNSRGPETLSGLVAELGPR